MAAEYTMHINGRDYVTSENKSILRYLRDDLHLTSVKDGCSEGACGMCATKCPRGVIRDAFGILTAN